MIKAYKFNIRGTQLDEEVAKIQKDNNIADSMVIGVSWRGPVDGSVIVRLDDTEELIVLRGGTKGNRAIIEFKSNISIYNEYRLAVTLNENEEYFEILESVEREDGLIQYKAIETTRGLCRSKRFDIRSLKGLKVSIIDDKEKLREIERYACQI